MKRIEIEKPGGLENLKFVDAEQPKPQSERFFSKFRIVALIIMTFLSLLALFLLRIKECLLEMLGVPLKQSVSQSVNGKQEIK